MKLAVEEWTDRLSDNKEYKAFILNVVENNKPSSIHQCISD